MKNIIFFVFIFLASQRSHASWFDFFSGSAPFHGGTYRVWQANAIRFLKTPDEFRSLPETNYYPAAFQPTRDNLFFPAEELVFSSSHKLSLWKGRDTAFHPAKIFRVQRGSKFSVVFHYVGDGWEVPPGEEDEWGIPNLSLKNLRVTVENIRTDENGIPVSFPVKNIRSWKTGYRWQRDREGNLVYQTGSWQQKKGTWTFVRNPDGGEEDLVRRTSRKKLDEVFYIGLYDLGVDASLEEGLSNTDKIREGCRKAQDLESIFVTVEFIENDPDFGEISVEEGTDGFEIVGSDED